MALLDELFFAPALFEPVALPDLVDAILDPPVFFAVGLGFLLFAAGLEPAEELPAEEVFGVPLVPDPALLDLEPAPVLELAGVDFLGAVFADEDVFEADDLAFEPVFLPVADEPDLAELDFGDVDRDPPVDFADTLVGVLLPFLAPGVPAVLTTAVAVPTAAPLTAPSAAL